MVMSPMFIEFANVIDFRLKMMRTVRLVERSGNVSMVKDCEESLCTLFSSSKAEVSD